jgi:hypothetical protein
MFSTILKNIGSIFKNKKQFQPAGSHNEKATASSRCV